MSIEKSVLEKLLKLTGGEAKGSAGFRRVSGEKKAGQCQSRRSLRGLWADLGVDISPEDIAEARREMRRFSPRGCLMAAIVADTRAAAST